MSPQGPPAECPPPVPPQQSCLGPIPSTQYPPLSPTLSILERFSWVPPTQGTSERLLGPPFSLQAPQEGLPPLASQKSSPRVTHSHMSPWIGTLGHSLRAPQKGPPRAIFPLKAPQKGFPR